MVGRLVIGLLVLASALVGASAGLLLVYSTICPRSINLILQAQFHH